MFLRLATVVPFILALLTGCGEFRPIDESHVTHYKVQKGETLYSIAFRFGYDYHDVALWNHILPPYIIHAGDDLVIPDHPADDTDETESVSSDPVVAVQPGPKSSASKTGKPPTRPAKPPVRETPTRTASNVRWSWPTQGKVAARFSAGAGRKGVDVAGKLGQPVKAAAAGDVVYSGSGLIGYGNLVIIKHDEVFLSAYAHNRKLLVKEGDKVKAGQPIGEMGQNAKAGSILHFEIRRHGKPVDPLLYLPNQPS